jgi:hypothetical protein
MIRLDQKYFCLGTNSPSDFCSLHEKEEKKTFSTLIGGNELSKVKKKFYFNRINYFFISKGTPKRQNQGPVL